MTKPRLAIAATLLICSALAVLTIRSQMKGADDSSAASLVSALTPPSAASGVSRPVEAAAPMRDNEASRPPSSARQAIAAAIRDGYQSSNYRQYIHQALATPSPTALRVGYELATLCRFMSGIDPTQRLSNLKLPPAFATEFNRRKQACEQSTGPDWDQLRALTATKVRLFNNADDFLVYSQLSGALSELTRFHRVGDVQGMAAWGLMAAHENVAGFAGEEPLLTAFAEGGAGSAWQAAVCERFGCDDFNARIVRCRDEASCQMSLQDILKESSGVDDATWQQLLAAARRRLEVLLPG